MRNDFLKWLRDVIAEHTLLQIIGTVPAAYLTGIGLQVVQGTEAMFDALPPLFWPISAAFLLSLILYRTVVVPIFQFCRNYRRRKRQEYQELVNSAFWHLAGTYKPETLNPESPGNPDAIKLLAQADADRLRAHMVQRKRLDIPPEIDVADMDSLREWFEFVRRERARVQAK